MSDLIIAVDDKEGQYYRTINLTGLLDPSLSWKAKGIHTYIRTRPENWRLYFNDLINRSTDGETSVRAGINELLEKNYLARLQIRDSRKIIGGCYLSFNHPTELNEKDLRDLYLENLHLENQDVGFLNLGSQNLGTQDLDNQDYSYNNSSGIRIRHKDLNIIINNDVVPPERSSKLKLTRTLKPEKPKPKPKKPFRKKVAVKDALPKCSEEVKSLLDYWNSLKIHTHLRSSKIRNQGLRILKNRLKSYSYDEIKRSMGSYKTLLDDEHSILTDKYPYKVNLFEFFEFQSNPYYKINPKSFDGMKNVKSWFEECLKDDLSHLLRMGKDKYPELTEKIKQEFLWKISNIEVEPVDENSFRKTAILLTDFWNEHLDRFALHPSENRNVEQFLHIFIEYLKYMGDIHPGVMCWALSDKSNGNNFYSWLKKNNYLRAKQNPALAWKRELNREQQRQSIDRECYEY